MSAANGVIAVPEMSADERIRVFRRTFHGMKEFEGMEVDAYAIITGLHVIILDTMMCPEDVSAMMELLSPELQGRTVLCIDSHADWDHAWGNCYFTGEHAAPIIAHEHCLERLQSAEARKELLDFQQCDATFQNVTLVPPTIIFNYGLAIHDGNLTIELLYAPGHHLDQIVAWIPQLHLLLAFDAVEKPLPIIEGAICAPHMFTTLERLISLQPQHVLCSHGKTTSPELVKQNLAYVREIERRCKRVLQTGRPHEAELEHTAEIISYPFDEVVTGITGDIDCTFYSWAHETNCRAIMQWLMS